MNREAWAGVREKLGQLFGERDTYWTVFDPREADEPVAASLADDIAGVYGDLKAGLDVMGQAGLEAATWEWRSGFWTHWGRHAAEAMRTLHWLLRDA